MDPVQAAKLGIKPEDVAIEIIAGKYNGHWIVHVPSMADPERGLAILTSTPDIYAACWWKGRLRMIVNGS